MTPTQRTITMLAIAGDLDRAARVARGSKALKKVPSVVTRRREYEPPTDTDLADRSALATRFGGSVSSTKNSMIVFTWPHHERIHAADDLVGGAIAVQAMMEDAGVTFPIILR